MLERFTKDARAAVERAEAEARAAGSRTVEAEHLLLASAQAAGMDRGAIEDALAAEWRASLDAAGIELRWPAPAPYRGSVRFGTSAKLALHRAVQIAADRDERRVSARHVALGTLRAELGTVPRALEAAGIGTFAPWRG